MFLYKVEGKYQEQSKVKKVEFIIAENEAKSKKKFSEIHPLNSNIITSELVCESVNYYSNSRSTY